MHIDPASQVGPARKEKLTRRQRFFRLLTAVLDPRAYLHGLKLLNYHNYAHVQPRRKLSLGKEPAISPNAVFSHAERIVAGDRLRLGARCTLWAGPSHGKIKMGNDVLFGPEVFVTAANYRFNDGSPVTEQAMEENNVIIGNDVWIGARAIILPGVTIGDGAIIGAGAVVTTDIPSFSVAVGVPARVVAKRLSNT
ncbi:MAG: acyltransferase [Pseudomonadota bacterium]